MARSIGLAAALAAALVGFGCTGEGKPAGRLFVVTFQTMNNDFFVELERGLRAVIEEEHGDTLRTFDANWNALEQYKQVSDMIQAGAATIFLNPVNWVGVKGALVRARDSKVPVIVVDAPVQDQDLVVTTVASDNVEAGRLCGRAVLAQRPDGARIAVINHSINKAVRDRVKGFREIVDAAEGYEIAAEQEGKGTAEGSRPVMQDILTADPKIDTVFAINDPSALGAVSAIRDAGRLGQILIVAVDGNPQALRMIQEGTMYGTSAQFPYQIGVESARAAYRHLAGEALDSEIVVPVEFISRENVQKFLDAAAKRS
ncbi:MAG: sugar ABC transporter substrate-binding protein [Planctomycetes bacterium]|nr:sugar ABC transporter substrate-binding protein [Planctomycetota bacterium]